jgi:hypothetical protein
VQQEAKPFAFVVTQAKSNALLTIQAMAALSGRDCRSQAPCAPDSPKVMRASLHRYHHEVRAPDDGANSVRDRRGRIDERVSEPGLAERALSFSGSSWSVVGAKASVSASRAFHHAAREP